MSNGFEIEEGDQPIEELNRLVKKYGEGQIDAHTGVFVRTEKNTN